MTPPTVVKVVAPARLEPLEDCVRRIVALSDGSERMERWDFHHGAWVACPYNAAAYACSFVLSEADGRKLGIPPGARDGTASGGSWDGREVSEMDIENVLIIVARDQPELLARLKTIYADASTVEVRADRRQGQPWTGSDARPDRRAPPNPDTDLYHRGFIVVPRSSSP